ncbi:uncharacterized protein N0V89_011831 [Didymosphaeria variabile]|uniref:Uncharacterized protein n=1 Tax=Didymosphaeria variabile TaxID=1932322 RepID=A0A9W8XAT2_9PLEO|nr:uncharacterized protein N0V89_011831 [Didymosphaeria variabile]KAJ4345696.1 hypothetical protein N0V89_011831 [Didymosphaeria variabile]
MVHEFVLMSKKFVESYETQVKDGTYQITGRWKHGEESTYREWQWKGFYQYQHLRFDIATGTGDRDGDITFDAHKIPPGLDGKTFTPTDDKPEEFKWQALLHELEASEVFPFDIKTMALIYLTPETVTHFTVHDDDSLQAGIIALRNANKGTRNYTIKFVIIERTDPLWTSSSYEVGEDRRPKGKRRRSEDGQDRKTKKTKKTKKGARLTAKDEAPAVPSSYEDWQQGLYEQTDDSLSGDKASDEESDEESETNMDEAE